MSSPDSDPRDRDPGSAGSERDREHRAPDRHEGPDSGGGDSVARLSVPGMDCASCAGKVENALSGVGGLSGYETHPTTGRAVVTYDPDVATPADIVDAIEGAGYDVTGVETDGEDQTWIMCGAPQLGTIDDFGEYRTSTDET